MSIQSTINQGLSLAGLLFSQSPQVEFKRSVKRVEATAPEREAALAQEEAKKEIAVAAATEKVENRLAAEAVEKERLRQEDITRKTDLYTTSAGLIGPLAKTKAGTLNKSYTKQLEEHKSTRTAAISAAEKLYEVAPSSELHKNIGTWKAEIKEIEDTLRGGRHSNHARTRKAANAELAAERARIEESNRIKNLILNPGGK